MDVLGEPINRLNSQLNIAVGRTFRDANRQETKGSGRARGQEQKMEVISKANTKFHEALDELEMEIVQAKSVIERDLNRLRQARLEHQKAQDTSKQADFGSSVISDALASQMDLSADAFADPNLLAQISGLSGADGVDDMAANNDVHQSVVTSGLDDANAKPNGTDTAGSHNDSSNAGQNATSGTDVADPNAAFDFDAIFGDGDGSNGFDIDFGAADSSAVDGADAAVTADNIDDLFNSTDDFTDLGNVANGVSGSENQPNGDGDGGGASTAEDLDALLPGLGSYVNVENGDLEGDDFAMIDMPTEGMDLDTTAGTGTAQGQEDSQKKDGEGNSSQSGTNAVDGADGGGGANSQGGSGDDQESGQPDNGGFGDLDDIFGMDVGNMDGNSLDDFDWGV